MAQAIWWGVQAMGFTLYAYYVITLGYAGKLLLNVTAPSEPTGGGLLDKIIAPFVYAWNAITAFFQFITFQPVGVPVTIGYPITFFIAAVNVWLIARYVRGGA